MGKRILLNKTIEKENIQYEWVAESTACDVCKAMDGVIYDSANDIPDRPHPNCKCHIEIIEKETGESVKDPIEAYKKEREERQRIQLEIKKALGDTKSLLEEIDEYLNQVDNEEQKLVQFKQAIDFESLSITDKNNFNKAIENVEFAKFRGEKVKKELGDIQTKAIVLEGKIEKIRILRPILEKFLQGLEIILSGVGAISNIIRNLTVFFLEQLKKDNGALWKKIALDVGINAVGKAGMNDARELWNLSSFQGAKKYILENGKLYEKISDLNNSKLETIIRTKLNSQLKITEARGIVFNPESSIAQNIVKSDILKNFIHGKQTQLLKKRMIQDGSLNFVRQDSWDLYNALGHADIIDIKLDKENNLIAKIIDTYDFNKGDRNLLVQMARTVQEAGRLENYYQIIVIKVPYDIWINF